jgi:anti-sigma regulatory factor (Ser/Thr protein kinase)
LSETQQFKLTITSESSNLETVCEFITNAARSSGLTEKQTDDVQMAVDEAVTNVIEHAYAGKTNGRIMIVCEYRGDEFIVEIQDFGKPFDASQVRAPRTRGPLSHRTIGGLGIFFMKKLMDEVQFSSDREHGNRTRLVKRIKPQ